MKNISLDIPKNKIVVFTGVSGSGKSSIVFDTVAAEIQRQMNETYSSWVRGRLPKYDKPYVELIDNLNPSVIIDQSRLGGNAVVVCNFVPSLHFIAEFAATNSVFSFLGATLGIVIASLILLVDFDAINRAVENEIPVENEWFCAFTLVFSVVWLFMKILRFVLKVMKKDNKK